MCHPLLTFLRVLQVGAHDGQVAPVVVVLLVGVIFV